MKRSGPLKRTGQQLKRTTELKRSRMKPSPKAREKRADHQERMAELRPMVFARDGWRCARCCRSDAELGRLGLCIQAHHRLMRSHGGPDTMENLITLCGPNPAGCHGWAHGPNSPEAISLGFLISREAGPPSEAWSGPDEPLPRLSW